VRTEVTSRDLYKFEELDETAQDKAVENYGEMLARCWDSFDVESIEMAMTSAFLEAIGAVDQDKAPADESLPDRVSFKEWDVDRRTIRMDGYLTRETAPGLPWPPEADDDDDEQGIYGVMLSEPDRDGNGSFQPFSEGGYGRENDELSNAATQAVEAAISAGVKEYEYMFSRETLIENIEMNDVEFLQDGTLA